MSLESEPKNKIEQDPADHEELVRELHREDEKALPQDLQTVDMSSIEEDYPRDSREGY